MKRTASKINRKDCARFSKIANKIAAKIIAAQATGKAYDAAKACKNITNGKKFIASYRNDSRYLLNAAKAIADDVNEWGWN